jgi:hypothetical protein
MRIYGSMKNFKKIMWASIEVLPFGATVALAIFSAITMVFLVVDQFVGYLIWPIGLIASLLGLAAIFKKTKGINYPGTTRERKIFDLLAVIVVIVWIALNVGYTSRNVFVYRDPAVYNVTAAILVEEKGLDIEKTESVFGNDPNLSSAGAGFSEYETEPNKVFAQGQHLLPALMGLSGQIIGESRMFNINLLFGGVALMAVYGFARFIVKPRWAILAVTTIAISLPMLYFSRDTYTEPLAMAFTFGALSLFWAAHVTGHRSLWFLSGIVAGAGLLTRIDAYLVIAGFAAGIGAILIFAKENERRAKLKNTSYFVIGLLPVGLVGWIDLSVASRVYYHMQRPMILQELTAIFGILILVAMLTAISWKTKALKYVDRVTKSWRKPVLMTLAFLIMIAVIARPLWYPEGSIVFKINNIGGMQATEVFDLKKGYKGSAQEVESVTSWIKWYLGPIAAYLGAVGFILYVGALTNRKDTYLLPGLFVFLSTALVFLIEPSITPDQVWAVRRLLPVVIPFAAIFAVFVLNEVEKFGSSLVKLKNSTLFIASILMLWGPLTTSRPFIKAREGNTQLGQIYSVCAALPENSAILWVGLMEIIGAQTTAAFCDVPSVGYKSVPSQVELAKAAESARAQGYTPVVGLISQDIAHLPSGSRVQGVSNINYSMIEKVFYTTPKKMITSDRSISIGVIDLNGIITVKN